MGRPSCRLPALGADLCPTLPASVARRQRADHSCYWFCSGAIIPDRYGNGNRAVASASDPLICAVARCVLVTYKRGLVRMVGRRERCLLDLRCVVGAVHSTADSFSTP